MAGKYEILKSVASGEFDSQPGTTPMNARQSGIFPFPACDPRRALK
jgi:hypothetical protein